VKLLTKGSDRLATATSRLAEGKPKGARRRVAKARKLVRKTAKRLESRKGPTVVPEDEARGVLAAFARAVEADLGTLRDSLR